jgi:hypothetical protein
MRNMALKNIAQIPIGPPGGIKGYGPLGFETTAATGADQVFQNFISTVIGVISIVAIVWFIFVLLTGGIAYLTAGADKGAVESARKKITNGVIGLLVTRFGIFLVNLVGELFGIPSILNIVGLINVL